MKNYSKKLHNFIKSSIIFLSFLSFSLSSAKAGILGPIADTYLSFELSKSYLSNKDVNSDFSNKDDVFQNLKKFEDFAVGGNVRVFKYLGVNVNWAQTTLRNDSVTGSYALVNDAQYKSDQINTTALLYLPVLPRFLDLFVEGGVVDIGSKLIYTPQGGAKVQRKSHETMGLYGLGLQLSPFGGDYLRLTAQRYIGKIGLLDTDYTTIRFGYLKSF